MLVIVTVAAVALLYAPAALADTTSSTNWAGYALHGTGVTFRGVQGSWRQPSAICTPGASTYSSYWVGIGGYSESSQALDQIGTEIDCLPSGQMRSTAWYELVPAGAVQLSLAVHPGDQINAGVTVNGKQATLSLFDATRDKGFTKTLTVTQTDVTSAEWIVEAPSQCIGQNACQTLQLADFGTAEFTDASATSGTGHIGGIDDSAWQTTKIKLIPNGRRLFINNGATPSVGTASPSAVGANDRSFKVSFARLAAPALPQLSARIAAATRAAGLRHGARF